jgi:NAD(P)-dependent dehydrogenase (short-subunit alcohol dehydrogenase family)
VDSARNSVAATVARHGRVDCLVNAAGLTTRGTLLDTTPELFDQHVAVNLRGPFFLMQAAVADMLRRREPGAIVNIISTSELGGKPYLAPYVAAKAGLAGLDTEGEDVIQRRFHDAGDDWRERAARDLPMGKLAQVDEIADFVVFLLSSRSGVVTGSVIDWDQHVFGGMG